MAAEEVAWVAEVVAWEPVLGIDLAYVEEISLFDVDAAYNDCHQMTVVVDVGGYNQQHQMIVIVDEVQNEIGTAFSACEWAWEEQPTVELAAFQCPMHHAHLAIAS